jgi:hypothetical protein
MSARPWPSDVCNVSVSHQRLHYQSLALPCPTVVRMLYHLSVGCRQMPVKAPGSHRPSTLSTTYARIRPNVWRATVRAPDPRHDLMRPRSAAYPRFSEDAPKTAHPPTASPRLYLFLATCLEGPPNGPQLFALLRAFALSPRPLPGYEPAQDIHVLLVTV